MKDVVKRFTGMILGLVILFSFFANDFPVYAMGEAGITAVGWGTTFYQKQPEYPHFLAFIVYSRKSASGG